MHCNLLRYTSMSSTSASHIHASGIRIYQIPKMGFMRAFFYANIFLLATAGSLIQKSPLVVKETHHVPAKWTCLGPAPPDHVLELRIGLRRSNFALLQQRLFEVSDPLHAQYGQHLSKADVHDLIWPASDTLELLSVWLSRNGIDPTTLTYSEAKDWAMLQVSVGHVEKLLNASYSTYLHEDGTEIVRTTKWALPLQLHDHIDMIQPTTSFFRMAPRSMSLKPVKSPQFSHEIFTKWKPKYHSNPDVSTVCNTSGVTPLCLRTLYGTPNYQPQVPGKNKVGLTDYLGEADNRSDVEIFLEMFRPEAASAAYEFKVDVIDGDDDQQTPNTPTQLDAGKDLEGNLDAETIIGIDWPTPLIAYTTGGSPPFNPDLNTPTNTNEPYLSWLSYILSTPDSDLAQTISTSYADDEQTIPQAYAVRVCNEFAQLGARGVSLFFGSGDYGVGVNGTCISNDGLNTTMFVPAFPSSCPYITAVGATMQFSPEVVAFDPRNGFATGAGFSNYFERPSYQQTAVSGYVPQIDPAFAPFYNVSGRAYPNMAGQGESYLTIWNGTIQLLDGTSASTPTSAAVIALVNDALIAAGRPPLGFLNPWLYSSGYRAFTDVTSGSAIGCSEIGSGLGFAATTGWDAVTGFGTPIFPKILELLDLEGRWAPGGGWSGHWS